MPTYHYRCPKGHDFDLFQKISEKPRAKCPVCGAKATRMISGGAGLIFKGSGFYITDYGKGGKKPPAEGEKADKGEKPDKPGKPEKAEPAKAETAKPKGESKTSKADE